VFTAPSAQTNQQSNSGNCRYQGKQLATIDSITNQLFWEQQKFDLYRMKNASTFQADIDVTYVVTSWFMTACLSLVEANRRFGGT